MPAMPKAPAVPLGKRPLVAAAITLAAAILAGCAPTAVERARRIQHDPRWTTDHDGIIRGPVDKKHIALIFTGGEHGDDTPHILDILRNLDIRAAFFVTGHYLAKPDYHPHLRRIVAEGHTLGPHSDDHLLYCAWHDRSKSLVTRDFFREDILENLAELQPFTGRTVHPQTGTIEGSEPVYFVPPFEWYNADHVAWANEMGLVLVNFTPGSGSNRDWIPENHKGFVPSRRITAGVLDYEKTDPDGFNGFLLLFHLGSQRNDRLYPHLRQLMLQLRRRGYDFVTVDDMIR